MRGGRSAHRGCGPAGHRGTTGIARGVSVLFFFVVMSMWPAEAEDPAENRLRGWVDVYSDGPADATMEGVVATIDTTLTVSLAISGTIEVVHSAAEADVLFRVAVEHRDGTYVMEATREDLLLDEAELIATRTAEVLFELFDVADALTLDIVETVTEGDVAFGSISLVNIGFPRSYEVWIDDVPVGRDVTRVDRILTGSRTVEVVSPGEPDSPITYERQTVDIRTDRPAEVVFSIPYVDEARGDAFRGAAQVARATLLGESDASVTEPAIEPDTSPADDLTERLATVITSLSDATPSRRNFSQRHLDAVASTSVAARRDRYVTDYQISAERGSTAIIPRIDPVAESDLTGWRYAVTGAYRPFRIDPPRYDDPLFYEASDRTGTDIRDFYLFSSTGGIHFIMTFSDGDPMRTNAGYHVSLVSGEIELWWRLEGGSRLTSRTAVLARTEGEERELETFPSPYATGDFAVIGTIAIDAVEYARGHRDYTGSWDLEVTVEEQIENRSVTRDSIPWGEKVYF
ncbi:MAG: hypothetical protein ACLFSV_08140 [Alkalispirochaeta sp.]